MCSHAGGPRSLVWRLREPPLSELVPQARASYRAARTDPVLGALGDSLHVEQHPGSLRVGSDQRLVGLELAQRLGLGDDQVGRRTAERLALFQVDDRQVHGLHGEGQTRLSLSHILCNVSEHRHTDVVRTSRGVIVEHDLPITYGTAPTRHRLAPTVGGPAAETADARLSCVAQSRYSTRDGGQNHVELRAQRVAVARRDAQQLVGLGDGGDSRDSRFNVELALEQG